ncbi:MAG: protein phosphatase 2C domain-containing protein [Pseudolysinimonas sp.]|uniref:PP2C family protein-serine/threonine phosphatase n=1 Tax=Pseudolysinimonas sp. TaxID=2680009 RepID=UPI0032649E7C
MSIVGRDRTGYKLMVPGKRRGFVLDWAGRSDIGRKRAVNEDSVIFGPPVFAVADGMGGHAAGDRASAAVVERLAALRAAAEHGYVDFERVEGALSAAASDIQLFAAHIPIGAGTTVTGAVLAMHNGKPHFAVFNIGDSRVYLLDGHAFSRVTVDHSVVQELMDAGLLAEAEAEHHPDSNVITRAVGFREEPRPDLWMLPVHAGMRLLLCSDGLTKELDDRMIREHLAAGESAAATADSLMDAALAAGGRDNVTVVIIDVVAAAVKPKKHPQTSSSGSVPTPR